MTNPTSKKDDGPVLTIITDNVGPIVSTSQLDMELEMVDIGMNVDMVECNSRSNLADMGVRDSAFLTPRACTTYTATKRPFSSGGTLAHPPQNQYEPTWTYYFHRLVLHISFHVTLLSTLEPIFFFNYAIVMEQGLMYDQLGEFTAYKHKEMESHDAQRIRSQPFYVAFIQFLEYEGATIDPLIASMEAAAVAAERENERYNADIEAGAYMFPVCAAAFTVAYYMVLQSRYRYKNLGLHVLGEHVALMVFVAAYEFWFFTHVILKYRPFTTEAVMNYLMNCLFVRVFEYYPEIQTIESNVTAICSV